MRCIFGNKGRFVLTGKAASMEAAFLFDGQSLAS
jgi:hypothetical protein